MSHRNQQDTALRLLDTVRSIPVGRWCTSQQVVERLREKGHTVHIRTVQRDLWKLAKPFGIDVRGNSKGIDPLEWKRTRRIEE